MRNNTVPKYFLSHRKFENAKWVFKDNESGAIVEYNYSELSVLVINGYASDHNSKFAVPPYNDRSIDVENLRVRELNIAGGVIAEIDRGMVVGIHYESILPKYTLVDCYDYKYQCKECEAVLDEIRSRGEEKVKTLFCPGCLWHVETS